MKFQTPKFPRYILGIAVLFGLVFAMGSCGTEENDQSEGETTQKEGVINYRMTYPYFKDDFMKSFLPDQMTMEFNGHLYKNTVTKAGMFSTSIIADCKDRKVWMILDLGMKQLYCELDSSETKRMVDTLFNYPELYEVDRVQTDDILELNCDKYLAVYDTPEMGYDCNIYASSKIGIPNSNWCNQYRGLKEVMLQYEAEQFGLVTRFKATEILKQKVDKSVFEIGENFKEVPLERMIYELESIFAQVIE